MPTEEFVKGAAAGWAVGAIVLRELDGNGEGSALLRVVGFDGTFAVCRLLTEMYATGAWGIVRQREYRGYLPKLGTRGRVRWRKVGPDSEIVDDHVDGRGVSSLRAVLLRLGITNT